MGVCEVCVGVCEVVFTIYIHYIIYNISLIIYKYIHQLYNISYLRYFLDTIIIQLLL